MNPTVEVRGANLLKLSFKEKSNNGVTVDVIENKIRFHGTFSNDTYAYWGLDNPAVIKKGTKVSLYVNDFNNHGAFVWRIPGDVTITRFPFKVIVKTEEYKKRLLKEDVAKRLDLKEKDIIVFEEAIT